MDDQSWLKIVVPVALAAGLGACNQPYPADIRGSLDEARESALEVGLSDAPPWIEWNGGDPAGTEADLIRRFAAAEGLEIEWVLGDQSDLLEALEAGDLHLVAGGLTKSSPWKKHITLSEPISTCRAYVGVPGAAAPTMSEADIKALTVRVERASGLARPAEKKDLDVERVTSLDDGSGPAVAEEFTLAEYGLHPVGEPLSKTTHVLALPNGENALYAALTRALPAKPGCLPLEDIR